MQVVSCVTLWSELAVLDISLAASDSAEILELELECEPPDAETPLPIKLALTDADAFQPDWRDSLSLAALLDLEAVASVLEMPT